MRDRAIQKNLLPVKIPRRGNEVAWKTMHDFHVSSYNTQHYDEMQCSFASSPSQDIAKLRGFTLPNLTKNTKIHSCRAPRDSADLFRNKLREGRPK